MSHFFPPIPALHARRTRNLRSFNPVEVVGKRGSRATLYRQLGMCEAPVSRASPGGPAPPTATRAGLLGQVVTDVAEDVRQLIAQEQHRHDHSYRDHRDDE